MIALYIADIETNESEGIYKKIRSQVKAISKINNECVLINKHKGYITLQSYKNGEFTYEKKLTSIPSRNKFKINKQLNNEAIKYLNTNTVSLVYIRHMMKPSIKLIKLLHVARRKGIKIYYEIPTYPYFGEQYKMSPNKIKTSMRLLMELLFWPIIYTYISELVVIVSRRNVIKLKKMRYITNGIESSNIPIKKSSENDSFKVLGLGSIVGYHGYDKMLYGLKKTGGNVKGKKVEFHVVGESREIERLKQLAKELDINDNVIFHGKKIGGDLDNLFDQMDVALGCLALYRRNADIDTTLKVVEYLIRGIPFVTSGKIQNVDPKHSTYLIIPNDNTPLKLSEILEFTSRITNNKLYNTAKYSKKAFSWENIMRNLIM